MLVEGDLVSDGEASSSYDGGSDDGEDDSNDDGDDDHDARKMKKGVKTMQNRVKTIRNESKTTRKHVFLKLLTAPCLSW